MAQSSQPSAGAEADAPSPPARRPPRPPSLFDALLPIVVLIGLLALTIAFFGIDNLFISRARRQLMRMAARGLSDADLAACQRAAQSMRGARAACSASPHRPAAQDFPSPFRVNTPSSLTLAAYPFHKARAPASGSSRMRKYLSAPFFHHARRPSTTGAGS